MKNLLAHTFLSMFTQSKYMAFIMDEKGIPIEPVSLEGHPLDITVRNYMGNPVNISFDLPFFDTLDDFFRNPEMEWLAGGLENLDPGVFAKKRIVFSVFPAFDSRNVSESEFTYGLLYSRLPLTRLYILKLTDNRFLGVVTLNRAYDVESQPAALVDEKGAMLHFGRPFAQWLGIREPSAALGKTLGEFLGFETPIFSGERPFSPWKSVPIKSLPGPVSGERNARFVPLDAEADFRNCNFSISLHFRSVSGMHPNLAIGTTGSHPQDVESLNVFYLGPQTIVIKTSLHELAWFSHAALGPDRDHCLAVERVFRHFRIILDDAVIGEFFYDWMPAADLARGLSLFLRPGERYDLLSAEFKTAPFRRDGAEGRHLMVYARTLHAEQEAWYRVHTRPARLDRLNAVLCSLEDVTHLRLDIDRLRRDKERLSGLLQGEQTLTGASAAMVALRNQLPRVAKSEISVLIEGETGTGKEVLARAIHDLSARKKSPFVKIDCATIPENLMESELFGHEKGAFTGATESRAGRFEQADNGTVFLDEVANLTLPVQAKLLNVLQDLKIQRVGGKRALSLDVRIISASNIPLTELIGRGLFREDLFYRLNQFKIFLPPLRERLEDMSLYASRFLEDANVLCKKSIAAISSPAMRALLSRRWPGNLRELRNTMMRAVLLCDTDTITEKDLPLESGEIPSREKTALEDKPLTREELVAHLTEWRGNLKKASKALGVHRATLHRWVRRDGIDVKSIRRG